MTTHFLFSVFDKETACGRNYKGLDLTANIVNCDCKSCKNMHKLHAMKEEVEANGSTAIQRED